MLFSDILAVVQIDNQTSVNLLEASINSIESKIRNAKKWPTDTQ